MEPDTQSVPATGVRPATRTGRPLVVPLDREPCGWNLREKVLFPRLKDGERRRPEGGVVPKPGARDGETQAGWWLKTPIRIPVTKSHCGQRQGSLAGPRSLRVSFFTPSCDPTRTGHPSHPPKALMRHANTRALRQPPPARPPLPPQERSETGPLLNRETGGQWEEGRRRPCTPRPCTRSGSRPEAAGRRGPGTEGRRGAGRGGPGRAGKEGSGRRRHRR